MPDAEKFTASLKVNVVNCDTFPTFSDDVVLPELFGSFSCKKFVAAPKAPVASASAGGTVTPSDATPRPDRSDADDVGRSTPSVVVKPGCVDEPRLLIVRPLSIRVTEVAQPSPGADPADKPKPPVEKDLPIDAVIDRAKLAMSLEFLVETAVSTEQQQQQLQSKEPYSGEGAADPNPTTEKKEPVWRSLPRTQVYYDGMLDLLLEQFPTAQLRFRMHECITPNDTKKYGEVLGVIVQVSGANGTRESKPAGAAKK